MWFWSKLKEGLKEGLHPKVSESWTEEDRSQFSCKNSFFWKLIPCFLQQFDVVLNLSVERIASKELIPFFQTGKTLISFIEFQALVIEVIQAFEGFPHPDWPVHRIARNAKDLF